MKFTIGLLVTFFLLHCQMWAQSIARVENVKIQSKKLNQEREILIYTPTDYDERTNEYFNVIYVFDSQDREFFDYVSSIIYFIPENNKSFIVVGITSPYNKNLDYSRRNDFLPELESDSYKKQAGKYHGNADNFLEYVHLEVIPYINSRYRTLNQNTAIGHSLGASFVLYSLVKKPNLFQNYIAISPNLAYDENKLSDQLIRFDYSKIKNETFIYLSHADEGVDYWKDWKPARERVYSFFKENLTNPKITFEKGEFPDEDHTSCFPNSLNHALKFYFRNVAKKQNAELGQEKYEVTIRLTVAEKTDTVFITGNQTALGNWDPSKIEMKKISDFERELTVTLHSPAEFKFTKGNWDTELAVRGATNNIVIKPELKKAYNFEVATE